MDGSCLILDFDGTILETEETIYRSWAELWREQGHELPLEQWQSGIGTVDGFDAWGALEERMDSPLDPALRHHRRTRRDQLLADRSPRLGILGWLDEADSLGVPVGVASSSPSAWVEGHLGRLGLRDRFSCLVCCDGTLPAKPDPASYRLACERLGARPSWSVAVDDSPHGVLAAVGAGVLTVAVPHGLTAGLDFSLADVLVDSLDELSLVDMLQRARRR